MKKEIKASCGKCNSTNVYGMSRVVGYYSIIENWNESKQAELKDRQAGQYKISEIPAQVVQVEMEHNQVRCVAPICCD